MVTQAHQQVHGQLVHQQMQALVLEGHPDNEMTAESEEEVQPTVVMNALARARQRQNRQRGN